MKPVFLRRFDPYMQACTTCHVNWLGKFCIHFVAQKRLDSGFSTMHKIPKLLHTSITSRQNWYSLFACLTRVLFTPWRPGSPSGYDMDLKGGGPLLYFPLALRKGMFLALEEVPHGGASITPLTLPPLISSMTSFCADFFERSNFTAGPFIRRLSII